MTARSSRVTVETNEMEDTQMRGFSGKGVGIWSKLVVVAAVAVWGLAVDAPVLAQSGSDLHWVGTWATATVARDPQPESDGFGGRPSGPPLNFNDQTLRQIVRTTTGGDRVRVVLSNTFGTAPLSVGGASIARRDSEAAIVASSARDLTFDGQPQIEIPAGAYVLSDPVDLAVSAVSDLAIDLYLPGDTAGGTSPLTMHRVAAQTNYVSEKGNHVGSEHVPVMTTTESWFFLARVEVMAPASVGAVVAFGDSITDGTRSTPDTNNRWPNHLHKRLIEQGIDMGVLNTGIAANRLLGEWRGVNALARFARDVLTQSGVTHVVVLEGINDLRVDPELTAEDLIWGYRQLIARAHARGLRIYGATLLPCEGSGRWTPEVETKRQALNNWIRTSGAYDGVIDFDAAVRDPNAPSKLLPQYDSSDMLHPSDAGYQAMAAVVPLELFTADHEAKVTAR